MGAGLAVSIDFRQAWPLLLICARLDRAVDSVQAQSACCVCTRLVCVCACADLVCVEVHRLGLCSRCLFVSLCVAVAHDVQRWESERMVSLQCSFPIFRPPLLLI